VQSARPHPPRPAVAYATELTALDAPLQREILREWLARSENATSPSSLADDYEEFVITTVRDRPKPTPSVSHVGTARKLPAWTFAVGALPVAIIAFVVLALAHVGRESTPPPSPRHLLQTPLEATMQTATAVETPRGQPPEVAVPPTPTVVPVRKSPEVRAVATTPRPVTTAATLPRQEQLNPELVANWERVAAPPFPTRVGDRAFGTDTSDFGDRK
jgi:hypothetical protein